MEMTRQQLGAGERTSSARASSPRAQMLKGELEGPELEKHVEESVLTTTLERAAQLGARATRCSPPPSGSPAARSR